MCIRFFDQNVRRTSAKVAFPAASDISSDILSEELKTGSSSDVLGTFRATLCPETAADAKSGRLFGQLRGHRVRIKESKSLNSAYPYIENANFEPFSHRRANRPPGHRHST